MNNGAGMEGSLDESVSHYGPKSRRTDYRSVGEYVDSLALKQKEAFNVSETERLKAETALQKTKTDYLMEQMKGVPMPDPARMVVGIEPEPDIFAGFSPVFLIGIALLLLYGKKAWRK